MQGATGVQVKVTRCFSPRLKTSAPAERSDFERKSARIFQIHAKVLRTHMITRLQVDGFKNLVGVDLHFGPFTCIAGANGAGKSNLFDAIRFLGALASRQSLMQAAATVRDNRRAADVRSLFNRVGSHCSDQMKFGVEMIVPETAVDELGQPAKASLTFLRYELELGLRDDPETGGPILEIRREELLPIKQGEADKLLPFQHKASTWRKSVVRGARRGGPFVSTTEREGRTVIQRHQDSGGKVARPEHDGGSRGRPIPAPAQSLKRTIVSAASSESPTLLCAQREMESWLQLQLEPSALRQPSDFSSTPHLKPNGEGLPATLFRIARSSESPEGVYARVANRLAELIRDVREISVERDDKLEQLTLVLTDREGTRHPARSLSDGTLRFLALAVLEMDTEAHGVLCLEEPENGIHPDRITAMLRLLQDISMDVDLAIGPDNPLRQIIINTHSPLVVGECPDDSLVLARGIQSVADNRVFSKVSFQGLTQTWRNSPGLNPISRGQLLAYLAPLRLQSETIQSATSASPGFRRVRDRQDVMQGDFFNHMVAES